MVLIGLVIVLMIVPLYPKNYIDTRNFRATAFTDAQPISLTNRTRGINLYTNYQITAFRTSNTRTITETSSTPTSTNTKTYYYTSQDSAMSDQSEYYNTDYTYVPVGCESGTDYSLTTGEPCG
jgi:hypothetical protein